MDYFIEIKGLRVQRSQGNSRFELSIPEFKVARGEFIAVTGESGCGKSTLLDLLALVLKPLPEGHFYWHGQQSWSIVELWQAQDEDALSTIRRHALGYVPQSGGLFPFLNLRDNFYLPPQLKGQQDYQERIWQLAQRLGIANLYDRKPQALSGGQRQRAAILRAMAHQPDLILADEPTAAVDAERARKIVAEFHHLARSQGTAVIMVTHDQKLVAADSDRFYGFQVHAENEERIQSVCYESSAENHAQAGLGRSET